MTPSKTTTTSVPRPSTTALLMAAYSEAHSVRFTNSQRTPSLNPTHRGLGLGLAETEWVRVHVLKST